AVGLHRVPVRLPGRDRRRLLAGGQPGLHRPLGPPVVALPLLERTQALRRRAAPHLHRSRRRPSQVLDELTAAWSESKTRTAALQVWDRVIPFLAFPAEIRRIVYTTNTVESLHMQIRKTIK